MEAVSLERHAKETVVKLLANVVLEMLYGMSKHGTRMCEITYVDPREPGKYGEYT